MLLWSEYQKIDQLVLKRPYIRTYERMDVRTYAGATENIIFDQGVQKYFRVTTTVVFDQFYISGHNFITTDRIGVGY